MGGQVRADGAARAAAIVDVEVLAELLRQIRRERPRECVRAAARGKRHDQSDLLGRPRLRVDQDGSEQQRERARRAVVS